MDVDRKAVADPLALHCGWTGLSRTNLPPAETEREPGWYWVRVGDGPPEIAEVHAELAAGRIALREEAVEMHLRLAGLRAGEGTA